MTYTYDLSHQRGVLRLLVQDNDISSVDAALPREQRSAAFSDEELDVFLGLAPDVYSAAGALLRAWAANKQLIVTGRKFGSKGEIDYGAIRADLLKMAESYEKIARDTPADAIAEMGWNDFNVERIIGTTWQRGLLG